MKANTLPCPVCMQEAPFALKYQHPRDDADALPRLLVIHPGRQLGGRYIGCRVTYEALAQHPLVELTMDVLLGKDETA